ncbi:MAG: FIST C-terminal domain-containing protein, partial [Bacteroidia bacterium]
LNINEENNSMTFAGNVPEGSYIRLMRSNTQEILASAENSAIRSNICTPESEGLALLISCVGRRSILKERTEEELEEVRDILPQSMVMTGFYSYGEMSTDDNKKGCELYNQTLTITTICED